MFHELADFATRPAPFSRYTTDRLWTDPHVARQMLLHHLDPLSDVASRRASAIDGLVGWLDRRFALQGKRILDLGCGPGLYAERMARLGARVTGLDFSPVSIAHARDSAARHGLEIDYLEADYLVAPLPGPVDLATLIYGDFCALSPDRRGLLLGKIGAALAPGGTLVFDVFSLGQFAALAERLDLAHQPKGGFWAEGEHFAFSAAFLYPEDHIGLERYLVLTPNRSLEIFNWMQYYDAAAITAELAAAGFGVGAILDIGTGAPWVPSATPFAVLAEPR